MQLLVFVLVHELAMNLPAPATAGPLLPWLLTVLAPMSRTKIKAWLGAGRILVNGVVTTRHDHVLQVGDQVRVGPMLRQPLERAGVQIAFQNAAVIVLDKPAGLLTVATTDEKHDTAFARLHAHLTEQNAGRPFVVHRLDRDTSGLVLFARSAADRDTLQADWPAVEKDYAALVRGTPVPATGTIDRPVCEGRDLRVRVVAAHAPDAQPARTHYRTVSAGSRFTLLDVRLATGRKHQIRVHLASIGCPVVGDRVYGGPIEPLDRLGLHASRLAFTDPQTGERLVVAVPCPTKWRTLATT
jgi:23S rRNA pseudouridine1911/1915/1917 synthase